MKKRIITFLLIALILIAAVWISYIGAQRGGYTVYKEDDQWYIETEVGLPPEIMQKDVHIDTGVFGRNGGLSNNEMRTGVITPSWPIFLPDVDLRKEILKGGLTPTGLQWLQYAAGENKPIPICDLDNLYAPIIPEDLTLLGIKFCGERYYYAFSGNDYTGRVYFIYNLDDYEDYLENTFSVLYSAVPEITADETATDRMAWEILQKTDSTSQNATVLRYALHSNTGEVWYVCDPFAGNVLDEATLNMFCRQENLGFWVELHFSTFSPPVDFLAGFGVRPVE